jgi:soluble lytic murein transglycosylase-like protein
MFLFDGRGRASRLTLTAVVLAATACAGSVPIGAPVFPPAPAVQTQPEMQKKTPPEIPKKTVPVKPRSKPAEPKRARPPAIRLDSAAMELAVTREYAHGPLALALARRTRNPQMADRAASAVVREAERLRLSPSLLAAVLLIENAPLDSVAVSHQGAIGMMQVMPVHLGSFGCTADLVNVESNICHGARLLKHLVRRTGSVQLALKRYNGCVRGRNTPRCSRYPVRVMSTASRLRREVLASAAGSSLAYQEALSSLVERPASVPSQPVTASDTTPAPAGTIEAQCATLMGCLRYRWSMTN